MPPFTVEDPTFQPAVRYISAITNSNPAVITTTFDHDYQTGLIVRIVLPDEAGMPQINKKIGTITVTADDEFTINIDTTHFDVFTLPVLDYAQVVPIGEDNAILYQATRNVLRN